MKIAGERRLQLSKQKEIMCLIMFLKVAVYLILARLWITGFTGTGWEIK